MRRGEILGLKWDDIDLTTGKLTLRRSLGQTRAGLIVKDPKTHGSRRTILLPKVAVNKLIAHKGCQAIEKAQLGKAYNDKGLVCAQPDGNLVLPDYISNNFRFVVKRAGLPYMRFHDLRHSAATMLIKSGVPVKVVSERLGHSTIAITQDIYTHVLPDMQQQAADMVDSLFSGKIGIAEES